MLATRGGADMPFRGSALKEACACGETARFKEGALTSRVWWVEGERRPPLLLSGYEPGCVPLGWVGGIESRENLGAAPRADEGLYRLGEFRIVP